MAEVGIRALKQNASAVVAEAVAGQTVTITDRGRPVAQLSALSATRLHQLVATGRARPPRHTIDTLEVLSGADSAATAALQEMRDSERY